MIVVVLLIIFQWGTAKTLRTARAKTTKMTDVRVRLINEIIQGVRVIKAYAWESAAIQQVEETRSTELKNLRALFVGGWMEGLLSLSGRSGRVLRNASNSVN